jgi:ATP-binding cassette subfamily F protein uup
MIEAEIATLNENMGRPEFYQQAKDAITQTQAKLGELQQALDAAYARWEDLEALREQLGV